MPQDVIRNITVYDKNKSRRLENTYLERAFYMVGRGSAVWDKENESVVLTHTHHELKQMRQDVIEQAGRTCYICKSWIPYHEVPTIDHVQAKSDKGPCSMANMKCACIRCNQDKADMPLIQYVRHIRLNRDQYNYITDAVLDSLVDFTQTLWAGGDVDGIC